MQVAASGTQAATVDTEHTLSTNASAKTFVLLVSACTLSGSDVLELRLYTKVTGVSGSQQAFYGTYVGGLLTNKVLLSPPMPSPTSLTATLKQTAGSGHSYDWSLIVLD